MGLYLREIHNLGSHLICTWLPRSTWLWERVVLSVFRPEQSVWHCPPSATSFELQVDPFLIRWVSNYLTNRTQSVVLGGAQSNPLPVVSGVPQGSVLGPLLFLIYINGVSASVTDSKITLYADDIALYKIIRNPRDYTLLQGNITSVCSWIADNLLVLNILKCCYMVFSRKHHPTLPNAPLYVGDSHALTKKEIILNTLELTSRQILPGPTTSIQFARKLAS